MKLIIKEKKTKEEVEWFGGMVILTNQGPMRLLARHETRDYLDKKTFDGLYLEPLEEKYYVEIGE